MAKARTSSRATPTISRRWREKDARRVLKAWRRSRLSARAFAKAIGIDAQRLLWWRRRLEAASDEQSSRPVTAPSAALTFIPTAVLPTASPAPVTVRLPGGICVEIRDPVAAPPAWVTKVVAQLAKVAS